MLRQLAVGLTATLVCVSSFARADAGDPRAGRAFALQNCRQCHNVGVRGQSSSVFASGPAFRAIANASTTTPLSLFVFLTTSHPTMPNLVLSRAEIDDVVSYIMSLRAPAPSHT
jgi:mono/diheme cytochrome c family protein